MRKLLLSLMAVIMIMLSSCGNNTEPEAAAEQSYVNGFCMTENEIFYAGESTLYYYDCKTGSSGVLCSKPDCSHEGESLNNPHPTCGGWVEGINTTCPMTIGEHLYFLYTPEETTGGGYAGFNIKKLCRADKDGYFTIDAVTENYIYVSRICSGRSVIGVMEKEKFLSGRGGEIRELKTF